MAAKFGSDVTTMSPADIKGAKFIRSGVVDQSGAIDRQAIAGLIEGGNNLAVTKYKENQIDNLTKDINPIIEQVKENSPSQSIFDSKYPNAPNTSATPDLKAFTDYGNKLKAGVEQGSINPEHFDLLIKSALRKAANNNPGMTDEFVAQANNMLNLSGVREIMRADEELAKANQNSQDELRKYYMGIAKDKNITIPFDSTGQVDLHALIPKVKVVQEEQAIIEGYKRKDSITEYEVAAYGNTFVAGTINEATNMAVATLNDQNIPFDKAKLNISLMYDSVLQTFLSDPKIARIAHTAPVQEMIKNMKDQINSKKTAFESYASKEDALKYLKNDTEMIRNKNYIAVSKTINTEALDVFGKLMSVTGVANVISKHPEMEVQLFKSVGNLIEGLSSNSPIAYESAKKQEPLASIVVSDLAVKAGEPDNNMTDKTTTALGNAIKTTNIDIRNLDVPEAFKFYEHYIKTLGRDATKAGLAKLDSNSTSLALENVNDYMSITMSDMKNKIRDYTNKNIDIKANVLGDGRLVFETSDWNVTNELNMKYAIRINDGLSAFSNLQGYPNRQAGAKDFFAKYQSFFE